MSPSDSDKSRVLALTHRLRLRCRAIENRVLSVEPFDYTLPNVVSVQRPAMLSCHFVNVYPPHKGTSGLFHFAREVGARVQAETVETRVTEIPVTHSVDWWQVYQASAEDDKATVLVYQFSPHLFHARDLTEFASLLLAHQARGRLVILVWHDANAKSDPELGRGATWSYVTLPHLVSATCVFTEEERGHFPRDVQTYAIPHYIRVRPLIDRAVAREALGLGNDRRLGGVLGFLHPRKGAERALALISPTGPLDELVFAGKFISHEYEERLRGEVARAGLEDRVHFTGYLTDTAFTQWSSACDVGLCPFVEVSASGSLSDWFTARKPVVAQALPQLSFYENRAGRCLQLVDTTSAEDFRRGVETALQLTAEELASMESLANDLAPDAIAKRYIHLANQLTDGPRDSVGARLRRLLVRPLIKALPPTPPA